MREPYAMTDSSARADGNPTARTLILKGVGPDGWRFASDAGSVKARDPAQRPFAALPFYWSSLARQIRVRGPAVAAGEEDSAADFLRPSRSHWPGSTTSHPRDTRGCRSAVRWRAWSAARRPGPARPSSTRSPARCSRPGGVRHLLRTGPAVRAGSATRRVRAPRRRRMGVQPQRVQSRPWIVSDELRSLIEPLLPEPAPKLVEGKPRVPDRQGPRCR
ncbi:pyridoxamine 5'-phosphate oxidase family protein [Streptomyces sp. NPDC051576]|uniref:pyridoxamine 5'-phosphate oxidase family protein n=1 Tax=Streptomyces sp. NPDC051576 TaxID=3155803 RepID=UPI0034285172